MQATRHAKLMHLVIGEDRRDASVVKFSKALGRRLHPWPSMRCRSRCRPRRRWRRPGLLTWCARPPPFILALAFLARKGLGIFSGARRDPAARDSLWKFFWCAPWRCGEGFTLDFGTGARRGAAARDSLWKFFWCAPRRCGEGLIPGICPGARRVAAARKRSQQANRWSWARSDSPV